MRLKLVESQLNETYVIDKSAISAVYSTIGTLAQDRGNGPLCAAMCSIVNDKKGTKLDPKEYLIHHLNGYHTDNDYKNLVLIKVGSKGWTHAAIHENAIRSAISSIMYEVYKYPDGQQITDRDIAGLTPLQMLKLSYLILNMIEMGTERKSNNWNVLGKKGKDKGFIPKKSQVTSRDRKTSQYDIILMRDII